MGLLAEVAGLHGDVGGLIEIVLPQAMFCSGCLVAELGELGVEVVQLGCENAVGLPELVSLIDGGVQTGLVGLAQVGAGGALDGDVSAIAIEER